MAPTRAQGGEEGHRGGQAGDRRAGGAEPQQPDGQEEVDSTRGPEGTGRTAQVDSQEKRCGKIRLIHILP